MDDDLSTPKNINIREHIQSSLECSNEIDEKIFRKVKRVEINDGDKKIDDNEKDNFNNQVSND